MNDQMNVFGVLFLFSVKILKIMALLFSAIFLWSTAANASDGAIRIGYNSSPSFPHIIGKGTLPADPPGLSVEIIEHIGEELGLDIEFVRMPGLRVLNTLKANNLDAAFLFSYKPEREDFGVYPMLDQTPDNNMRLSTLTYALYRQIGSPLKWDGERLLNFDRPVGANIGYSIVDFLRKKNIEVEEARDTSTNIKKLQRGRVSAIADQDVVVDAFLRMNDIADVEKIYPPLISKAYFLIFSHDFAENQPQIMRKMWQLISDKRESLTHDLSPKYLDLTCPC